MRYWVGCTITTVNTGLSCDIEIGNNRESKEEWGWAQTWQKIGGQLDIRDDAGDWMYGSAGGISLVSSAMDNEPSWHDPANWLVRLNNVPERFTEKISCGEYLYGDGELFLTHEEVRWKMWYPCA